MSYKMTGDSEVAAPQGNADAYHGYEDGQVPVAPGIERYVLGEGVSIAGIRSVNGGVTTQIHLPYYSDDGHRLTIKDEGANFGGHTIQFTCGGGLYEPPVVPIEGESNPLASVVEMNHEGAAMEIYFANDEWHILYIWWPDFAPPP